MNNNTTDTVQFISLGPGGADNVTLGVAKIIGAADKIYCFGSHGISHSADTLHELTDRDKVTVVDIPMSKDRTEVMKIYRALAETVAEDYARGRRIAVATEGDTGIFATSHYVMDMLTSRDIPCTQSAGIPSFIAAGAVGGLHLTKLGERLLVVPGDIEAQEIITLIEKGTNVVIMKLSMATDAVHECMGMHPEYNYHFFRNIGMDSQEYINDRNTLQEMQYPYFSLMIIQP